MSSIRLAALSIAALTMVSVPANAQSADEIKAALKARQSHMTLNSFNLGVLGDMAQGKADYDADAANAAAQNLVALASINQTRYWIDGTLGIDGTKALPEIQENYDDFVAKQQAVLAAAQAMEAAAGTDLPALQAAMGGVGGACGACHKAYRAE